MFTDIIDTALDFWNQANIEDVFSLIFKSVN